MTQEQSTPVVYTSEAWVTRPAPEFTLPAFHKNDMVDISLSSFKGKYLVLLFYPKDFTFVCPTEILAFNDRLAEFQAIGADVVAISCDHTDSHWAWANTTRANGGLGPDLQLPLLADKNLKVAKKYGILEENAGISLRGLFIISDKGILRSMTVNDFPVGRSVDETLRLIKAFQFTDTHGEVCPAGWDPKTNSKTMKDNQKDSKAYFQAVNK